MPKISINFWILRSSLFVGLLFCLIQRITGRNLDLVMLLEPGRTESLYRLKGSSFITDLQAALSQKVPILTTGVILHNALAGAAQFRAGLAQAGSHEQEIDTLFRDYDRESKLLDTEYQQLNTEYKKLKAEYERLEAKYEETKSTEALRTQVEALEAQLKAFKAQSEALLATERADLKKVQAEEAFSTRITAFPLPLLQRYLSYLCNFDFAQWFVFKHVQADIYLLIPQEYEAQKVEEFTQIAVAATAGELAQLNITQREATLGLNVDHPNIMLPLASMDNLMSRLNADWGTAFRRKTGARPTLYYLFVHDRINLQAVQDMFVRSKSRLLGRWNIFWGGHGGFTLEKYIKEGEKKKKDIDTWIAGVPKQDFFAMLRFFAQNILVNSLYFSTCYGGGYHLDLIAQAKYQTEQATQTEAFIAPEIIDFPYLIISGALTDASTSSPNTISNINNILAGESIIPNFKNYFSQMNDTFNQILTQKPPNLEAVHRIFLGFEPTFTKILANLTNWQATGLENARDIAGIPLIWYPGSRTFKVVAVGENIEVIEDERVTTGIPIQITHKNALLIYPPQVTVPLTIRVKYDFSDTPLFVSMIPGPALHHLSSIDLYATEHKVPIRLNTFLSESIFSLGSPYTKRWIIGKLQSRNYENSGIVEDPDAPLVLENMVIQKTTRRGWFTGMEKEMQGTVIFSMHTPTGQTRYFTGEWDYHDERIKQWKPLNAQTATKKYKTILGDRYDDTIGKMTAQAGPASSHTY